jgi:hypothetical protein
MAGIAADRCAQMAMLICTNFKPPKRVKRKAMTTLFLFHQTVVWR